MEGRRTPGHRRLPPLSGVYPSGARGTGHQYGAVSHAGIPVADVDRAETQQGNITINANVASHANRAASGASSRKKVAIGAPASAKKEVARRMKPEETTEGNTKKQKPEKVQAPPGYTVRKIEPAKNADVVSVAKAMNRENFAPMLQDVFKPEVEATKRAFETGVYVSWRVGETDFDCQRVGYPEARCFCMHSLAQHEDYLQVVKRRGLAQAKCEKCACKAFAWVPSRPEEVGEFWLRKRRNFDPTTWRAMCKCKHSHEQHDAVAPGRRCKEKGCGCLHFMSAFLCAACDKRWEVHETVIETEMERRQKGLPYGEAYIPFAEMPELRDAVLTGRDGPMDPNEYNHLVKNQMRLDDMPAPDPEKNKQVTGANFAVPGKAPGYAAARGGDEQYRGGGRNPQPGPERFGGGGVGRGGGYGGEREPVHPGMERDLYGGGGRGRGGFR